MIHDPELLEKLANFSVINYKNEVFRATPKSLDPLAGSSRDGRWHYGNECSVLYTSTTSDGSLAEIVYHWSMLDPLPSKPVILHKLKVEVDKSLKLLMVDLESLGVEVEKYDSLFYNRTQEIGSAVNFLGHDGLIVPSARWGCDNLVIFCDNLQADNQTTIVHSNEIDWQRWARNNSFLTI